MKFKKHMKFILAPVFIILGTIFSTCAYSEEVKLLCNLTGFKSYKSNDKERINKSEIFEISEFGSNLYISPQSDDFAGVSNKEGENVIRVENFSNSTKWDLAKTIRTASGVQMRTRIIIDRNAGRISYDNNWNDSTITVVASGPCEKIQEKRKF